MKAKSSPAAVERDALEYRSAQRAEQSPQPQKLRARRGTHARAYLGSRGVAMVAAVGRLTIGLDRALAQLVRARPIPCQGCSYGSNPWSSCSERMNEMMASTSESPRPGTGGMFPKFQWCWPAPLAIAERKASSSWCAGS